MLSIFVELNNIIAYLSGIPLIIGLLLWKKFDLPLRIYFLGASLIYLISIGSRVLAYYHHNTNWLLYLSCLCAIILYCSFYNSILKFQYSKFVFISIPCCFLIYFILDITFNGIRENFVLPFLLLNIIVLIFAIWVFRQNFSNKVIRILNIGVIITFTFNIAFEAFSNFLYNYFQSSLFDTFFFEAGTFIMLLFLVIQIYAHYLASKQVPPSFENNPNFE